LTYDQVNRFFKTGEGISNPAVEQNLNVMRELAQIIGEVRNSRGALDFNVKEAKVILSKTGKVLDVVLRSRDEAEQLIESFMIQANEVVAEAMEWSKVPMVFRIHDEPKEEKIAQFKAISRLLGYNIPEKTPKIHIKTLQKILVDSETKPYGIFLHNLLLRSMAKARYDSVNIGHYGLASGCYTHFTSPIRRYPDLTVHRLVKKYLLNHSDFQSQDEQLVASVSSQASQQERLIERLERDVLDMKKCEYMEQFIDRTFTGVISSVVPWGFYVELPNTIEGLVSVDNMGPDYYLFNEERLEWRGQYSGKRYRIGDIVNVVLLDASKKRRQISFQIEQATK
jgi:ribonuclease R